MASAQQRKRHPFYIAGLGDGDIHQPTLKIGEPRRHVRRRARDDDDTDGNLISYKTPTRRPAATRLGRSRDQILQVGGFGQPTVPPSDGPWQLSILALALLGIVGVLAALFFHLLADPAEAAKKTLRRRHPRRPSFLKVKKKTDEWSDDEGSPYPPDADHTLYYQTTSTHYRNTHQQPQQQHRHRKQVGASSSSSTATNTLTRSPNNAAGGGGVVIDSRPYYHHTSTTAQRHGGGSTIVYGGGGTAEVAAASSAAPDLMQSPLRQTGGFSRMGLEGFVEASSSSNIEATPLRDNTGTSTTLRHRAGSSSTTTQQSPAYTQSPPSSIDEPSASKPPSWQSSEGDEEDYPQLPRGVTSGYSKSPANSLSLPAGHEDLEEHETPRTDHLKSRVNVPSSSASGTPHQSGRAPLKRSPKGRSPSGWTPRGMPMPVDENTVHFSQERLPLPFVPDLANKPLAAPPAAMVVEELHLERMESGRAPRHERWIVHDDEPEVVQPQQQSQEETGKERQVEKQQPVEVPVKRSESFEENDARSNIIHKRQDLTHSTDAASSLQSSIGFSELKLQEVIGGGGFGQVYKATWRGTPVAVKVLTGSAQMENVSKSILEEFAAEINMLKGMRHPNICLYMGACFDPPNRAIVTELAANGSLWDALRQPLSPPYAVANGTTRDAWPLELYESHHARAASAQQASGGHPRPNPPYPPPGTWPWVLVKKVAAGAARGMTYLHSGNPPVLHRDMKSANLLLDDSYTAKVCDFGLSRLKAQERSMTGNCGTVQWMAPEVLANQRYAEPADVYSFGVILWELLSRECPYEGMSAIQCALAVLNKDYRPEIPVWCPPALAALIKACLEKDPSRRPTFPQILAALDSMP